MLGWRYGEPSPLLRDMMELLQESRRYREGARGEPMPINVHETDTEVVVEAVLPGVKPEDVEISAHDGVLTIRAVSVIEERDYSHQEVISRVYLRQLALPQDCRLDEARAESEHGVLTVRVPKRQPKAPERIRIEVNRAAAASPTPIEAAKGEGYSEVEKGAGSTRGAASSRRSTSGRSRSARGTTRGTRQGDSKPAG
jgi:HSP20 family protein